MESVFFHKNSNMILVPFLSIHSIVSSFTFYSLDTIYVAVAQWMTNSLSIFTFSDKQLQLTFTADYASPIKSSTFSMITSDQVPFFYCLLNHIDGGIRILKLSSTSWTEDKFVSFSRLFSYLVPYNHSSWRVSDVSNRKYYASYRTQALSSLS